MKTKWREFAAPDGHSSTLDEQKAILKFLFLFFIKYTI